MVKLIIGHKGSGKTKTMVDLANSSLEKVNGSVVFINKNARLTYDLKYRIRVICMEDFDMVTNIDEYTGFILGILSQDHDIEEIFIDAILKHADIKVENLPAFFDKLAAISDKFGTNFTVSVSADKAEIGDGIDKFEIICPHAEN